MRRMAAFVCIILDGFRDQYDLLLIDTQGARRRLLEMAVLASDLALSPINPEMLAARELSRGALKLLGDLSPFATSALPYRHCDCC